MEALDPTGLQRAQTILLVDDEADIRESLKQLFETSFKRVQVLTAEAGAEGLQVLRQHSVDLIISDYKMQGMDGLQFLAQAKILAPRTLRIIVTAFPDLELAIRAVNDARVESFFTKPFDPKRVVDTVTDLLAQRRAQILRDQSFARSLDVLRRQVQKE